MAGTKFNREWNIYALTNDGVDFYVGRTLETARRLDQHRRIFGRHIEMRILQTGRGHSEAVDAERTWIAKLASNGTRLANKMAGSSGAWEPNDNTLAKMRAVGLALWQDPEYVAKNKAAIHAAIQTPEYKIRRSASATEVANRPESKERFRQMVSRPRSDESKRKQSASTRGKPRTWSPAGELRVKGTQFKAGNNALAALSQERLDAVKAKHREHWKDPALREAMLKGIRNETPEQRLARINKSADTRRGRPIPPHPNMIAKAKQRGLEHPEIMSGRIKRFWEELRKDPVRYREYIDNRAKAIAAARAAKRGV